VADENVNFDWAAPDEEVHAFVNDLKRHIGVSLYGRRMYDVMVAWENPDAFADQSPITQDFAAIWQAADKIVYSGTLQAVASARTRIERTFDPAAIRRMITPIAPTTTPILCDTLPRMRRAHTHDGAQATDTNEKTTGRRRDCCG